VPLMKRYLGEVPGEFDLIMFNHSLEHMPDPVETPRSRATSSRAAVHVWFVSRPPRPKHGPRTARTG
jgi:Rps23 Pro-64 3,4-dihydroxylase Tpa1-like proline 4-hydroxylase